MLTLKNNKMAYLD